MMIIPKIFENIRESQIFTLKHPPNFLVGGRKVKDRGASRKDSKSPLGRIPRRVAASHDLAMAMVSRAIVARV